MLKNYPRQELWPQQQSPYMIAIGIATAIAATFIHNIQQYQGLETNSNLWL